MEEVDVAQELQHEGRGRMVVDLVGRALLFDAALVHHHHAVGHFHRLFLVVGDEDAGHVHLVVQPAQPAPQLLAYLGVQRAEGFVEQQHLGLHRQRTRQRDALALAAAQLVRVAPGQPIELHQFQQLRDLGADGGLAGARRLGPHAQAEGDVLEDRHVAEERVVLEHETDVALAHVGAGAVFAVEEHMAAVGHFQPGDDAQQRRLARTRRPEQGHQFAGRDVQVQRVANDGLAEGLVQIAHFNAHRRLLVRCARRRHAVAA